jgi:uncharacterized protein YbbK (DUF523 family)
MDSTWDRILLHPTAATVPRLAVSSCLLGNPVRYDGTDKKAETVATAMAYHCELLPVCPEVEMEMGVPRETIRIEEDQDGHRFLIGNDSGTDYTPRLQPVLDKRLQEFRELGMSGFVWKARSPSCAPGSYPLHAVDGDEPSPTYGLFAAAVRDAFPLLPMIDEEGLHDHARRRRFNLRMYAHFRLRQVFHDGPNTTALRAFHVVAEPVLAAIPDCCRNDLAEALDDPRTYCHRLLGCLREANNTEAMDDAIRFLRKAPPGSLSV